MLPLKTYLQKKTLLKEKNIKKEKAKISCNLYLNKEQVNKNKSQLK
jgi:hypothetical protein